jgi:U3 small nucleolar RNA-associated protein 23
MIRDADKFKMDLLAGLERTLHGQVKPMITQCSMRHLYAAAKEPGVSYLVDKAKTYERRRCNHLPEDYPEPLSTKECLASVVDPKNNNTNKHRYVVASQELDVRKHMRGVSGVPLVYINRSVMIMEPMADVTTSTRDREEKSKFRDGLKRGNGSLKRKRDDGEGEGEGQGDDAEETKPDIAPKKKKKKKIYTLSGRVKGANSLHAKRAAEPKDTPIRKEEITTTTTGANKRKRKRKHKADGEGRETNATEVVIGADS